ncbi:glycosyltransferase [Turicibacter sanguinis]|uniref:glycosyltransferase family 2 protein n=1 Tax=Turicibacter sanguinis TaxID=154288 RepID=UPI0012BC91C5|nr:glycosyltransferase family 2 protein [Turicibacter sanguinis]MDB8566195.1 glycosyltransferase family 2 protein [Turicibacter sanguinis]MDB8568941.1 glycosyltransferase family 2 protein [Turicibacter sanguinis]MDB8571696.1 glycosyltransferase family 2 protein [Turicibacter sanguinis]MDB8580450.1 glycosyltransferase family 2 protein [Turicibacter sanguinis]MTO10148.1 glycosyltransferase [Turicibacter sanguinis]
MKVSVIIPVYQAEKFLARCIESILNQTLDDIELILVNDGSTDGCGDIINYYSNRHENIIVENQENQGIVRTKQNGLKRATGEYILFVDDDDWLHHDALEKLYLYAKQENADLVYYNFYQVVNNLGYPNRGLKSPLEFFKSHLVEETITSMYHCTLWRKLIKREYINKIDFSGIPNVNYWEDWIVGIMLTLFNPSITYLDEYLYFWNIHQESTTGTIQDRCSGDIIQAFEYITDLFKKMGIFSQYKDQLKQRLEENTAWMLSVREQNVKCADEMLTYCKKWLMDHDFSKNH